MRASHLARGLAKLGASTVVVKLGALGALALDGDEVTGRATEPVDVVDPVGAGDAFVAGYLSDLVDERNRLPECLRAGQPCRRRRSAGCRGDWEGLPTRGRTCTNSTLSWRRSSDDHRHPRAN